MCTLKTTPQTFLCSARMPTIPRNKSDLPIVYSLLREKNKLVFAKPFVLQGLYFSRLKKEGGREKISTISFRLQNQRKNLSCYFMITQVPLKVTELPCLLFPGNFFPCLLPFDFL